MNNEMKLIHYIEIKIDNRKQFAIDMINNNVIIKKKKKYLTLFFRFVLFPFVNNQPICNAKLKRAKETERLGNYLQHTKWMCICIHLFSSFGECLSFCCCCFLFINPRQSYFRLT